MIHQDIEFLDPLMSLPVFHIHDLLIRPVKMHSKCGYLPAERFQGVA
jgi:hypothetical protein